MACGALGAYDRARVQRIAELIGGGPRPVHEDAGSILMLDREAVAWEGDGRRGLGWVEGEIWRPSAPVRDWREAARAGATGLVLEGRQRYLHTAVNGLAPLYWIADDGALYFASRIDPLVRSSERKLTIDWDAWASTIALRYPLGERTPFAEIRRLPQFSTLRRRFRRARVEAGSWPWAEVEPGVDVATAAERLVVDLSESLAPLPRDLTCPLSGGRDSRLLFFALARESRVGTALTVSDDEGDSYEEGLAALVATAFGVPHECLAGTTADYPAEWEERARRVEHQFVDHAWLEPLARRLADTSSPVPDGFAIDVFFASGRHFYTPETLDSRNGRRAGEALFDSMRRYGLAQQALAEPFRDPVVARAREQFRAATRELEGHPSQALLSLYATRSLRGVSTYATGLLGSHTRIVTPGAGDAFVTTALSVSPTDKVGGSLYQAVFELLAPAIAALPSTANTPRAAARLPRRWRSAPALEFQRRSLADGPLADHLSPELRAWLDAPDGVELSGDLRLGLESISMLHAWWRRYRDWLRPVDAHDLRR